MIANLSIHIAMFFFNKRLLLQNFFTETKERKKCIHNYICNKDIDKNSRVLSSSY